TNASPRLYKRRGLGSGRVWRPWQLIAAAVLLLIIGGSALTAAAAAAGPDSPLFGFHPAVQNVPVPIASSPSDRGRLHLNYAAEALTQLNSAVAQQSGDPAYTGALTTFLTEQQAAADGLAQLPPGAERDALTRQLADLRAKARADLHAALPALSWRDRL